MIVVFTFVLETVEKRDIFYSTPVSLGYELE